MAEQGYNLKYTGREIDDLLDKVNDMDSSAQVPAGGTSGQVLTKKSGTNYDAEWETPGSSLPSGGTPSQVLTKKSLTAGDAEWRDAPVMLPAGGNAGQILQKKSSTRNDAGWVDVPSSANPLPAGGSAGQALVKNSSTNYDVKWATIQSGGGSSGESDLFVVKVTGTSSSNFAADKTYDEMVAAYQAGKAVIMVPKDMAIDSSTYQIRLRCLPLSQLYSITSSSSTGITTTREYATFASPYLSTSVGPTHSTMTFAYITWSRTSKSDGTVSESISNSTGSTYTIPYGGKTGQLLAKKDDNSYSFNMQWIDPPSGSGNSVSTSVIIDSSSTLPGNSSKAYTFDALNNGDRVIVMLQRESGRYTTNEYTWYGTAETKLMVCHPNDNQGSTIFGRAYLESTQITLAQTAWWSGYEYTGALSNTLVTGYKVIVARYS